jgi:hypothetical protein
MDDRCPRQLEEFPETWCPQAVIRLKAIRNAGRELTEEEETLLPGCPWAINCQVANYCFFQYVEHILPEKPLADVEVAGLLNVSVDVVKRTERSGLSKMRQDETIQELGENSSV